MKPSNRQIPWGIVVVLSIFMLSSSSAPVVPEKKFSACEQLNLGNVRFETGGAQRVTFAVAKGYDKSKVIITSCVKKGNRYVQEWKTTGYAGANGFAPPGKMWEDTLYSPTGSFTMTEAFGREDPGTALDYQTLNKKSRWSGTRGPDYNQYFEGRGRFADENLWKYMKTGDYEQAAVINWNRPPDMQTQQGASYAIFFHAGNAKTWGCISTELETVEKLLRHAVPGDRMVMGTRQDVFKAPEGKGEGRVDQQDDAVGSRSGPEPPISGGVLGLLSRLFSTGSGS